jgi:hypothetical protein
MGAASMLATGVRATNHRAVRRTERHVSPASHEQPSRPETRNSTDCIIPKYNWSTPTANDIDSRNYMIANTGNLSLNAGRFTRSPTVNLARIDRQEFPFLSSFPPRFGRQTRFDFEPSPPGARSTSSSLPALAGLALLFRMSLCQTTTYLLFLWNLVATCPPPNSLSQR